MKTTFVLSLEEDTAAFLEEMRNQPGQEDPNVFINELLRKEMSHRGEPARGSKQTGGIKELEHFVDNQIPSAG